MDELFKSFGEWFKERTTSPLYGTWAVCVVLWNWKFFYILFLQEEERLGMPKIDYLTQFLQRQDWWLHALFFIVLPAVSTFVAIYWLPILSNAAHKQSTKFYRDRKIASDQILLAEEKRTKAELERLSLLKEEQAKSRAQIERHMTEEEKWLGEIRELDPSYFLNDIKKLKEVIYTRSGAIWQRDPITGKLVNQLSADTLASFDAMGLVNIEGTGQAQTIAFTPKGKFFIMNYPYVEEN